MTLEQSNAVAKPVIVNHEAVIEFWPDQNPIGQMFSYGNKDGPWLQVIGVVGDVKQHGITNAPYAEAYQAFDGSLVFTLVVHTSSQALNMTSEVRHVLSHLDSTLPLFAVRTMDEIIADHASGQQFLALLLGLFSALALLLAAIGIYGVLSYLVTQRTREIGIRMSLGASRVDVLALVLKQGMRLAGIGFSLGLVGALATGRVLSSLLHEVRPSDPTIIVLTALCLSAVAFAACYLPARRAARVDPIVALRYE